MDKKLFRSRQDKVIAGVCGGIAEYFEIDATIVRLLWVLLIFMGGTGILAYIIFAIVVPEKPREDEGQFEYEFVDENAQNPESEYEKPRDVHKSSHKNSTFFMGAALIMAGALLILNKLHLFDFFYFWPSVLILLGLLIIFKRKGA